MPTSELTTRGVPEAQAKCPRILVVDDLQDNLDLIVDCFRHEAWNVKTARDAQAAWEVMKKWRPDLVLLDIHMPGLDGRQLCAAMGMKMALNDVPVIFLTAEYTHAEDVRRGLDLGACDYLCKPVHGAELRARVRLALARHARREPTPS
jgi:DNA-binding response OmpR family regulator